MVGTSPWEVRNVAGLACDHRHYRRGAQQERCGPRVGISCSWVQQLAHRYQREGPAAFEPRSRRPAATRGRSILKVEDQIVQLRKTLTRKGVDAGAETIAAYLQTAGIDAVPAVSTIWRFLSRLGLFTRSRRNGPLVVEQVRRGPAQRAVAGRPTAAWPTAARTFGGHATGPRC